MITACKHSMHNWCIINLKTATCHYSDVKKRHDSVSNHQPHDCLLNWLFRCRSKRTSKLRVAGLCEGNSPGTGEFPAQKASNAENVSIWWHHHVTWPIQVWTAMVKSLCAYDSVPDSKVHGAYMWPTWGRQDPGGPNVGLMILAIWVVRNVDVYFPGWKATREIITKITLVWEYKHTPHFVTTVHRSYCFLHGIIIP